MNTNDVDFEKMLAIQAKGIPVNTSLIVSYMEAYSEKTFLTEDEIKNLPLFLELTKKDYSAPSKINASTMIKVMNKRPVMGILKECAVDILFYKRVWNLVDWFILLISDIKIYKELMYPALVLNVLNGMHNNQNIYEGIEKNFETTLQLIKSSNNISEKGKEVRISYFVSAVQLIITDIMDWQVSENIENIIFRLYAKYIFARIEESRAAGKSLASIYEEFFEKPVESGIFTKELLTDCLNYFTNEVQDGIKLYNLVLTSIESEPNLPF